MPHRDKFIHLHVHTEFSLLDGACRINELINRAKELGMPALAVTDHGTMYSAIDFYLQAQAAGIKPIIGCETYVAPRTRHDKETKEDRSPYHLTLLAKNETGYKNLIKLVSLASIEGFYNRPRIDRELLERYHEGLVVLSGCAEGEVSRALLAGDHLKAKAVADWYKQLFGADYYLEAMELGLPQFAALKGEIAALGRVMGIPVVATNDVHYVRKDDAYVQDVLVCIQTNSALDDPKRLRFESKELYLKSGAELAELFKDLPEAIKNTAEVAEKCNLTINTGVLHLPDFPVPENETPESYLEKICWEGIKKKYGVLLPPEIIDRVKYELYTIEKMGYSAYFLIVSDFINWAKSQGIQVGPGRGSAAGSIVAYALGITNLDPLKYGLIFERFLNIERVSMPDIDVDFCFERRGEVIDYVTRKYGKERVAQIVTFGTMAARGSIRDVGRVQGIPLNEVDKIAKMVPFGPDIDLGKALTAVKELKQLYDTDPRIKKLIDTARRIEGMSRHASVHAAGIVISKLPLAEHVPLQKLDENVIVTQYPMEFLEKIGLLKMDFLGLRNLTMIAHAVEILKEHGIADVDINNLPLDDAPTYKLFNSGETVGIFQLESRGMRELIKRLKPSRFEEIIALLALYRPGPLESGMVDDYVDRKHGKKQIHYELPELQPILRETYGTILYQEQVMEIASKIAGFSMGQADVLRAAMGKKKVKEMAQQKELFIEGAVKRGISKHKATELFNLCAKFAGYGFNKSHSTAYALISYQTAYLKANYPVEFMAALLTSVMGNSDKVRDYIAESQKMKIKILPPDINESAKTFTLSRDRKGIRFGLTAIKNVGLAAIDNIIEERKQNGHYASFFDFYRRIDSRAVNKKVVESLIKAGAFDSLGEGRAYLLANYSQIINQALADKKEQANGQEVLFNLNYAGRKPRMEQASVAGLVDVPEFSPDQLLRMEKELLGLYISSHPLERLQESLEAQVHCRIADLFDYKEGQAVKIGGLLTNSRRVVTKKGDTMLMGELEDMSGSIPLVVFPKSYEKCGTLLNDDEVLIVKGRLGRDFRTEALNINVESVEPLQQLEKVRSLHIEMIDIADRQLLSALKEQLVLHPGADPVYVHVDGRQVELNKNFWVDINPALIEQIERLLGSGAARVEFNVQKVGSIKEAEINV